MQQEAKQEKIIIEKGKIQALAKYTQEHKSKATIQVINSFLPFIGIWIAMYLALDVSYWLTLALGIVNTFFLVRIFIIQHDCGHQSFVKNRKAQKIIGHACSYFSTIPFKYWAKSHNVHHKVNGQLEMRDIGDVPTFTTAEFKAFNKAQRFFYRVYRSPVVMFLLSPMYYLFVQIRSVKVKLPSFKNEKKGLLLNNLLILAVFTILGFTLGWAAFLIVHLTILALFSMVAMWFFYVQHQHEHGYKQWKKDWDYVTAALKGSTYYKIPRLFNWLTGHIGLHHIHHLNPAIPNYNLKKCIQENPWLKQVPTVITFRQSLKLMSHKLWDETQQRMISFREFYELDRRGLITVPVKTK